MNKKIAIQLKATFLLFIFSLNMFVGFACSIGLVNVSDAAHQHQDTAEKTVDTHSHKHNNKQHHHDESKPHNHKIDHKGSKEKKGCCSDEVQKVQQLDKNISSNAKAITPELVAAIPSTNYRPYVGIILNNNPAKLRERFFYPPPPNILLKNQRFQI